MDPSTNPVALDWYPSQIPGGSWSVSTNSWFTFFFFFHPFYFHFFTNSFFHIRHSIKKPQIQPHKTHQILQFCLKFAPTHTESQIPSFLDTPFKLSTESPWFLALNPKSKNTSSFFFLSIFHPDKSLHGLKCQEPSNKDRVQEEPRESKRNNPKSWLLQKSWELKIMTWPMIPNYSRGTPWIWDTRFYT